MTLIKLTPLLLACASSAALAQGAGSLQACRAMTDATARLACYDALPLPGPAAALPAAPAAAAASDANRFGLEAKSAQQALQWVDSTIEGRFDGWGPNSRIKLANGQVWQVTDDSTAVMNLADPKVQVRRGVMGAFYLEFERSNRTARVKRVE
jgi:hypothetical protein